MVFEKYPSFIPTQPQPFTTNAKTRKQNPIKLPSEKQEEKKTREKKKRFMQISFIKENHLRYGGILPAVGVSLTS